MSKSKKIVISIIAAIILAIGGYVTYMCVHYFFYDDYKNYLKEQEAYKEGKEFTALEDNLKKVAGMVLAAENENLMLYTNTDTTEVAIYDKRTGEITYSNPVDRANDPLVSGTNASMLNSQLVLSYYDSSMTEVIINNYDMSVSLGQFQIESVDNGIRYIYLFGNMSSPTGLVPPYITEDRLETLVYSQVSEKQAKKVKSYYIKSKSKEGFLELTKGAKSKIALGKLEDIFMEAGYTQEDFDTDAAAAGNSSGERVSFRVPLEYRLTKDSLEVCIPTDKIVETGNAYLTRIDVLRYFGAGSSLEDGYLFVPNASGSLINFNNNKKTEQYNQSIYGMDPLIQSFTVVESTKPARLPVFGIKHENSAVFARIRSGESLANLIADVSGNLNSYNYVFSSYLLRGFDKASTFGVSGVSADLPTIEKSRYNLDIKVDYTFLTKENADYSGMANCYRNQLIEEGVLTKQTQAQELPFYLDILGGVKLEDSRLGIPYSKIEAMTTFAEAEKMIDAFIDSGVTNIRANYLGWFNGGYYHSVADKIKVNKKLGSKKELSKLTDKIESVGGKLFGDVAFQKVSFTSKRYNYKLETSQYYVGYVIGLGKVNPATVQQTSGLTYMDALYNVVSPKFLVRYVDQFTDKFDSVNLSGVSLRDLGDLLSSDKKRSNVIDRNEAQQIVTGQLEKLGEAAENIMVSGGNAYSLANATDLINVPQSQNEFYIVDQEVPFYEMVVHGCIDYAGETINLADNYIKEDTILRMIELGMAPHFGLSYEESSKIKYSSMNHYYSSQYDLWKDDAIEIYTKTNEVLKDVTNSCIINHDILAEKVTKTTYENGVVIYVNRSESEYSDSEVSIPAKGYVRKEVKG